RASTRVFAPGRGFWPSSPNCRGEQRRKHSFGTAQTFLSVLASQVDAGGVHERRVAEDHPCRRWHCSWRRAQCRKDRHHTFVIWMRPAVGAAAALISFVLLNAKVISLFNWNPS